MKRVQNLLLHKYLPGIIHLLVQRSDQERHLVGELEGDEVPLHQVAKDVQQLEDRLGDSTVVKSSGNCGENGNRIRKANLVKMAESFLSSIQTLELNFL